jgi:ATP-dependent helicase/DNAse subunit B
MERVLRVEERDRPEDILVMSPSDRGTLIHTVLERFIAVQLGLPRDKRIRADTPWPTTSHARIDSIADDVFGEYEDQGLIGHRQLWSLGKTTIRRELHRFLVADDEYRRRWDLVPERVELRFGDGHGAPVELPLARGGAVTFKGSVDRVDLADDGSMSVIDYKTGSRRGFAGIEDDPLLQGQRLQLPLYGLAARRALGDR